MTQRKRQMFTDLYRFAEKHDEMPNTAQAWRECANEAAQLFEKHNDPYFTQLLCGVYHALAAERGCYEQVQLYDQ